MSQLGNIGYPPIASPLLPQLQYQLQQTLNILSLVLATPGPTYNVDGQSVDKNGYLRELRETVTFYNEQIQINGGCFEFQTQACPGGGSGGAVWPI